MPSKKSLKEGITVIVAVSIVLTVGLSGCGNEKTDRKSNTPSPTKPVAQAQTKKSDSTQIAQYGKCDFRRILENPHTPREKDAVLRLSKLMQDSSWESACTKDLQEVSDYLLALAGAKDESAIQEVERKYGHLINTLDRRFSVCLSEYKKVLSDLRERVLDTGIGIGDTVETAKEKLNKFHRESHSSVKNYTEKVKALKEQVLREYLALSYIRCLEAGSR